MNQNRNYSLDLFRGFAALVVFWAHLAGFMLAPLDAKHKSLWLKFLNASTGYGHQAVMVFFVLSGYLISRGIWDNRDRWKVKDYATKRLTRLWIVLIPCLLVTLTLNWIGINHDLRGYYQGSLNEVYKGQRTWPVDLSLQCFLGNLAFVQTIFTKFYGDNEVLWSLANEFWYYVLFPCVVFSFKCSSSTSRIVSFLGFLVIGLYMPMEIKLGFGIWLIGFIVHILNKSKIAKVFSGKVAMCISIIIFLVTLQATHSFFKSGFLSDIAVGISFGACVACSLKTDFVPNILRAPVALLSDMSYTLYLSHFSFIAFFQTVIMGNVQLSRTISSIPFLILFATVLIFYSYVLYWIFERNTEKVRNFIFGRNLNSPLIK